MRARRVRGVRVLVLLAGCSDDLVSLRPLASDTTIVAFGDSLTFGTGAKRDQSYPAVLSELIQRRVVTSGVPGELSKDGLKRLPGVLEEHQPGLVILCHGGNDCCEASLPRPPIFETWSNSPVTLVPKLGC